MAAKFGRISTLWNLLEAVAGRSESMSLIVEKVAIHLYSDCKACSCYVQCPCRRLWNPAA